MPIKFLFFILSISTALYAADDNHNVPDEKQTVSDTISPEELKSYIERNENSIFLRSLCGYPEVDSDNNPLPIKVWDISGNRLVLKEVYVETAQLTAATMEEK